MRYSRLHQFSCFALLALFAASTGCTRYQFRRQADAEVAAVFKEKDVDSRWKILNMHVYSDPRARFGDPNNPDRPPMPPDDAGASLLAPVPQKPGHAGIEYREGTGYLELLAQWDAENRAKRDLEKEAEKKELALKTPKDLPKIVVGDIQQVAFQQDPTPKETPKAPQEKEAPATYSSVAVDQDQDRFILKGKNPVLPYLLTIDNAIAISMINSREYQTRREDLYLAAIPVTRERFSFSAQGFMTEQLVRERTGDLIAPGKGDRWKSSSNVGVGKLFSTGALLLFQFANQTAINLTNPALPHVTSTSLINLDFVQPFLRGGGRAVTLEPLTLTERNLLYNIRTYARFRKQYYQYITGGSALPGIGGGTGLTSSSGATGASSTSGTIGVNNGGNVGPSGLNTGGIQVSQSPGSFNLATPSLKSNPVSPSGSGTEFLGFTPSAPSEGIYATILKSSILDIGLQNIARLQYALGLFQGFEVGGDVAKLQVDQVELQLLAGKSTVLSNAQDLRNSLDSIKLQMGIPVTAQIEVNTDLLRSVMKHMSRYEELIREFDELARQADILDAKDQPEKMRTALRQLLIESKLTRSTEKFRKEVPELWDKIQQSKLSSQELQDQLEKLLGERRKFLDLKTELELREKKLSPEQLRLMKNVEREISIIDLELTVRNYEQAPWRMAGRREDQAIMRAARWRDVRNGFTFLLGAASNERLDQLRPVWPKLPKFILEGVDVIDGDIEEAYAVVVKQALENRLDLMNVRAQVHDTWRQIAIFANGLLGTFNVAYHMDSSTPTGVPHPFAFQPGSTQQQLFLNFQLPLVRIAERNAYRASLIGYQRARRSLMESEDIIVNQVRTEVRQLQVLSKNFKIQQQNVELAFLQIESALETFRAPPVPGQGGNSAANAASLTNQVLQAYQRVPTVQGQLLNNYITFITARQQLILDTELMQIDNRGVWIDEFADGPSLPPNRNSELGTRAQRLETGAPREEKFLP